MSIVRVPLAWDMKTRCPSPAPAPSNCREATTAPVPPGRTAETEKKNRMNVI